MGHQRLLVHAVRNQAVQAAYAAALHGVDLVGEGGASARIIVDFGFFLEGVYGVQEIALLGDELVGLQTLLKHFRASPEAFEGFGGGIHRYSQFFQVCLVHHGGVEFFHLVHRSFMGIKRGEIDSFH